MDADAIAALERSERRYRALVQAFSYDVWHSDGTGDGGSSEWWEKQTGQTADEARGWGWLDAVHPDDRSRAKQEWTYALTSQTLFNVEYRIRTRTAGYRHYAVRGVPVLNSAGQFDEWIGTITDIHDHKQVEEQLRHSEARFRAAVGAVSSLIWTNDADGMMVGEQTGWGNFTGQTYEEYQGYGWSRAVHPEDAQPTIDEWNLAVAAKRTFVFEHRVRRHDGEWRLCSIRAVPLLNDGGKVREWVGIHTDITEAKLTVERERQLLADTAVANAKFRAFFDQGALFAGMMSLDGIILEANLLSCEGCGFTRDRIVGKPFWDGPWWSRSPALVERIRAGSAKAAAGEEFRAELPYFVADGSERVADVIILPIKNEAGHVQFLAPTGIDITERKLLEMRLRQLAADLSEADRRKDEFLATLAHELRNPLAPIRNGLQILKLAGSTPIVAEKVLAMMERQLSQMVRLVDDLLDVSRISRGKVELRKERIDLATVVQNAVETSLPLIEQQGHSLTVTLPPDPVYLDADATRLAQVFLNLLNNAAKYSEKDGQIWLTAEQQGAEVIVSVKDTGIGISAAHMPRIFELFSQVSTALEKSQGGLGIGLSLVKGLVELQGGTIEARSDGPGKGSEFIVRLPTSTSTSTMTTLLLPSVNGTGTVEPASHPKCRILVVDDNEDATVSLAMMLEIIGHEVCTAHDGEAGVNLAKKYQPDIILMDLGMPRMNGYEAARHIRQETWGTRIILVALTGWGADDDRRKTQDAGFDRHLVKPVEPNALLQLLAELQHTLGATPG